MLSLFLAFYYFAFGIVLHFLRGRLRLPYVFVAPFVWVTFEYLRSFPYFGFPWFFAGHSQYLNLPLIQITDITGVYGISFLIVVFNAAIADLIEQLLLKRNYISGVDSVVPSGKKGKTFWLTIIIPSLLLSLVLAYGYLDLRGRRVLQDGPNVCVVQGNVPQGVKIEADDEQKEEILMKYTNLSLGAVGEEADLIVWPETMVPGILNIDPEILNRKVDKLSKESVRILTDATSANLMLGGTAIDVKDPLPCILIRSFILTGREGLWTVMTRYISCLLENSFHSKTGSPSLQDSAYSVSLSGGDGRTIFELDSKKNDKNYKFGVIICYEDTIAPFVRKFRKDGAGFLLNITNDAWFHDSSELDQHLAVMVFRAVENRITITRAANSGISSFVAPDGEIYDYLSEYGKYKEVEGILCSKIRFEDSVTSWYTNHGDVFAFSCILVTAILCLVALRRRVFA